MLDLVNVPEHFRFERWVQVFRNPRGELHVADYLFDGPIQPAKGKWVKVFVEGEV